MKKETISILFVLMLLLPTISVCANTQTSLLNPVIVGPDRGIVGEEYEFCISYFDSPDNDDYLFQLNWGDGEITQWSPNCYLLHSWQSKGTFDVMVRLKYPTGETSNWSDPHQIEIVDKTQLEIIDISFFPEINFKIKNVGDETAYDVMWEINIEGGIFSKFSYDFCGEPEDILPGEYNKDSMISSSIFGFGGVTITIKVWAFNVDEMSETANGIIFGRFILILGF